MAADGPNQARAIQNREVKRRGTVCSLVKALGLIFVVPSPQPENKHCAECGQRVRFASGILLGRVIFPTQLAAQGPTYADLTVHTYACTTCSGMLYG